MLLHENLEAVYDRRTCERRRQWQNAAEEGLRGGWFSRRKRGRGKLRERRMNRGIYAQFGLDLHRNKSVELGGMSWHTLCNGREIFQRRERNESQPRGSATKLHSGNRRRQADGKLTRHERPEGEGKCGLRLQALSQPGRQSCDRVTETPDLRKIGSLRASSRKRIRPLACLVGGCETWEVLRFVTFHPSQ